MAAVKRPRSPPPYDPIALFTAPLRPYAEVAPAGGFARHDADPAGSADLEGGGLRLPSATDVAGSFFPTRRRALEATGYDALRSVVAVPGPPTGGAPHVVPQRQPPPLCVVAADTAAGTGAKRFSVLRPAELLPFVGAVPESQRCLYVVLDPAAPLDPFFDVDHVVPPPVWAAWAEEERPALFVAAAQEVLLRTLQAVLAALQRYFGVAVEAASVFNGCSFASRKVSWHVHCRMPGGRCFRDMAQHKHFAATAFLPDPAAGDVLPAPDSLDRGVYTAWRNFRLPFCHKRLPQARHGPPLSVFTAPCVAGDSAAAAELRGLLQRHVLDVAEVTPASDAATWAALVGADLPDAHRGGSGPRTLAALGFRSAAAALHHCGLATIARVAESIAALSFPDLQAGAPPPTAALTDGRAPFRAGQRAPVMGERHDALLRLFRALDPAYGGLLRLTRAEYEDSGQVRMYYAMQKQVRYCLRQGREHRATFGQLYVTYSSIKFRCYANDCHDRCHVVAWTDTTRPLRDVLFPDLADAELRRRYPWEYPDDDPVGPAAGADFEAGEEPQEEPQEGSDPADFPV